MSKATYSVVVIREGRDKDYFNFWRHGLKTSASGEELHSDLVGFTEAVEAKNKQEAESLVKKMYPGLSIDAEATQRLG
jgi:hypothetical protein